MMRKFLALLLVLTLALPALVMPASAMPAASPHTALQMDCHGKVAAGHGERNMPASHQARHDGCIGCIAPFNALPQAPGLLPLPAMATSAWVTHALPSYRDGPDTPPPRQA